MIRVSFENIEISMFDFSMLNQRPIISALEQYVNRGDNVDFNTFTHNIGIDKKSYQNSQEYLDHATATIDSLKNFAKNNKNTTIFDPKLLSAVKDRFFNTDNLDKFAVLTFDCSEYDKNVKSAIFESVRNAPLKSIASYCVSDNDKISVFYAQKCLALTEDGFHWYTSRDKVSLFEGKNSIKDCNIMSLALCFEIAKTLNSLDKSDEELIFTYGEGKFIKASAQEIISNTNLNQEQKEQKAQEEAKQEAIENQAKAELKAEQSQVRASLAPASINAQNVINSDVKFDKNDKYANPIAIYRAKQEQKINQALAKADEAYTIVKQGLANNNTFNDCINFIKQKFGNDELLINLVMYNINADLATLSEKEQEILDKNAQIESLNSDKEKLNSKVTQAENEARKWNSSFQKVSIELERTKQDYEKTIEKLQEEAKNEMDALKTQYEDEIEGHQGTIERLDNVNKALQTSLNNEKATNAELIAKNVSLEQEVKAKNDEIAELEKEREETNDEIYELKKEYNEIVHKGNNFWKDARSYLVEAINRGYKASDSDKEFYEIDTNTQTQSNLFTKDDDGGSGGSSRSRQR
nr:hypothetical protein [uncultured Campylobacter sp.]